MRTKRIELEGNSGTVAIERSPGSTPGSESGSATIRIDSIVSDPDPGTGEQAWITWELPTRIDDDELFKVAMRIQERCDGVRGTNSDIHDYFRDLQRFQD